jgi:AbrB family looped-hinge helix DNA binding protein
VRRKLKGGKAMPVIRILRNGQLTLPAKFRETLELKQGDLLNAGLEEDKIILKPVTTVERKRVKEKTRERFFKLIDKTWDKNKDTDPKKVERIVNEAIEEVRKEETTAGTEK